MFGWTLITFKCRYTWYSFGIMITLNPLSLIHASNNTQCFHLRISGSLSVPFFFDLNFSAYTKKLKSDFSLKI